jgi:hypothetical protein
VSEVALTDHAPSRELGAAAERAAGALLRLGWSRLASLVAGQIARFDCNFETYRGIGNLIRRSDGKPYHTESIGRVVRDMARAGVVKHQRVMLGARPEGAKFASARGTTNKTFNWRAVTEKNPLSRRQRRLARQQQAAVLRDRGELVKPLPSCETQREASRPRYSARPELYTPAPPADLAQAMDTAARALERRGWAAGERQAGPDPVRSSAARERPPPD